MFVLLGTSRAVESFRSEVAAADHTADELRALAEQAGVDVSDRPSKELLAARLSAVAHKRPLDGDRVVRVNFPDGMPLMECAQTVTIPKGVWDFHSPGDHTESGAPAWVESDSPALQALLAEHFGCASGAPADVEITHHTEHGPPGIGPDGPIKPKGGR